MWRENVCSVNNKGHVVASTDILPIALLQTAPLTKCGTAGPRLFFEQGPIWRVFIVYRDLSYREARGIYRRNSCGDGRKRSADDARFDDLVIHHLAYNAGTQISPAMKASVPQQRSLWLLVFHCLRFLWYTIPRRLLCGDFVVFVSV